MAIGDIVHDRNEQIIGALAEAFVKIKKGDTTERYLLLGLTSFESSVRINTKTRGVLGRTGKVTYPTSWEGTWRATISYNTPVFRDVLKAFKETGTFPEMEIQTSNENTTGTIGRQTVIHKGVTIDSAILSKIDVENDDELREDISGAFNDFELPETFGLGGLSVQ